MNGSTKFALGAVAHLQIGTVRHEKIHDLPVLVVTRTPWLGIDLS